MKNSGLSVAKDLPMRRKKIISGLECYNDQKKKKLRKLLTTILWKRQIPTEETQYCSQLHLNQLSWWRKKCHFALQFICFKKVTSLTVGVTSIWFLPPRKYCRRDINTKNLIMALKFCDTPPKAIHLNHCRRQHGKHTLTGSYSARRTFHTVEFLK